VESAGIQVELRPAQADGFAGAQTMAVDQADQNAVAERVTAALAGGFDQPARFIGPKIAAIRYFRLFARRAGVGMRLNSQSLRD
jgi:hypothetical protein